MAFLAVYSRVFLSTPQIIPRSTYIIQDTETKKKTNTFTRVLLACIKYLGNHPCPRCLVEKCNIREFGSQVDLKRRKKLVRIDDGPRKFDVEAAQKFIYTKGVCVNLKRVAGILGLKSLVPTRVSIY